MALYIFDKDGTLVHNQANPNKPPNRPEDQKVLPGVLDRLSQLRAEGHKIAIASNQGGVAWGFIAETQAQALIDDCIEKIGGVDAWGWCPHDERAQGKPKSNPKFAVACLCRKPKTGLLDYCMTHTHTLPAETVFVGDQESDRQAAENAGVKFIWAKQFFNWEGGDKKM